MKVPRVMGRVIALDYPKSSVTFSRDVQGGHLGESDMGNKWRCLAPEHNWVLITDVTTSHESAACGELRPGTSDQGTLGERTLVTRSQVRDNTLVMRQGLHLRGKVYWSISKSMFICLFRKSSSDAKSEEWWPKGKLPENRNLGFNHSKSESWE